MPAKKKKRLRTSVSKKSFPFKKFLISFSFLIILLVALVFTALKTLSVKQGLYEKVLFEAPNGYSVKEVRQVNFTKDPFYTVLLKPNKRSANTPTQIWIYEYQGKTFNILSKIVPTFNAKEAEYPSVPLDFMSASTINYQGSSNQALLIRWGITGADFFGVYPIIITFNGDNFALTSPYPSEFREESTLKSGYTFLPLTIYNKNDNSMKANTYGVMDYIQEGDSLVAEFLGSVNCSACANPKRVDIYSLTKDGVVYNKSVKGLYYLDENSDVNKFVKDLDLK